MSNTPRPEIKYDQRFRGIDYETELIRQAYLELKTVKRTAGFLDFSLWKVNKALKRLARSEASTELASGEGARSSPERGPDRPTVTDRAGDSPEEL